MFITQSPAILLDSVLALSELEKGNTLKMKYVLNRECFYPDEGDSAQVIDDISPYNAILKIGFEGQKTYLRRIRSSMDSNITGSLNRQLYHDCSFFT